MTLEMRRDNTLTFLRQIIALLIILFANIIDVHDGPS